MLSRCSKARTVVPDGIERGSPLTMTSMLCDMILGYRRSGKVSTRGQRPAQLNSTGGMPMFGPLARPSKVVSLTAVLRLASLAKFACSRN